jgi:hypothetical protein
LAECPQKLFRWENWSYSMESSVKTQVPPPSSGLGCQAELRVLFECTYSGHNGFHPEGGSVSEFHVGPGDARSLQTKGESQ